MENIIMDQKIVVLGVWGAAGPATMSLNLSKNASYWLHLFLSEKCH